MNKFLEALSINRISRLDDMETKLVGLSKAISQILWEDWDPMGMKDNEEARDEYDSYVPELVRLKKHGADKSAIISYLREIEYNSMDLVGDDNKRSSVAQKINDL